MLIGIVGKANVGKSTFFKAATLAEVEIAPYPFTTIKANEGVGFVKTICPETEFKIKCKPNHGFCLEGFRFIPVKLLDVAGLVPGAHLGKGLGNKFLDDLRQADALIHIIDASGTTNEEGKPTQGYDPCKDIKFLEDEIDKWFYNIIGEKWKMLIRKIKSEAKPIKLLAEQFSGLKINEEMIKKTIINLNLSERFSEWTDEQLLVFVKQLRRSSKPLIIAANKIDLPGAKENYAKLRADFPNYIIIPCSAESELALREAARDNLIKYISGEKNFKIKSENLNEKQKKALEFIKEKILIRFIEGTGIQTCLNHAIFSLLNHIVVYPVENETHLCDKDHNVLPDAHLLPKGSTALDLAFAVHTDIGKDFIAAIDARSHMRLAKDHELKDNDIIRIMTR